jgi:hypothetical protein
MSAFAVYRTSVRPSTEQQEHFLRTAKVTASKEAGRGHYGQQTHHSFGR